MRTFLDRVRDQKLKEVRTSRLEKQLKSNILKRKKASKKNDGWINN